MSNFREFRRANGQAITLNIDLVRSLEPLSNGATKVYLDEQHIINLQDEYESVKAQLDAS